MPETFTIVMPLLAALSVAVSPEKVIAEPPEAASGKMVFDHVGDELRKYRKEKDIEKRGEWMAKLARTHDPRVAIELGETMTNPKESREARRLAIGGLILYYVPRRERDGERFDIWDWWEINETNLRRRAAQLPW